MKIDKAIDLLGWMTCKTNQEDTLEAIDMAIKALKVSEDGDLISRQDAIDAVFDTEPFVMMDEKHLDRSTVFQRTSDVVDAINALPSKADRPKGEWIEPTKIYEPGDPYWECDQCHKAQFMGDGMNFCPNCGAMMER